MFFRHLPVLSFPDVTNNFEQLQSSRSLAAALPSSPTDGQEIFYQNAAMATAGVVWTLRYRAASTSAYKWEFVGGSNWHVNEAHATGFETGAANVLVTVTPTVTVPLAGDYAVKIECCVINQSGACQLTSVAPANYATKASLGVLDYAGLMFLQATASSYSVDTTFDTIKAVAAGTVLGIGLQIAQEKTKFDIYSRAIEIKPVRVG